MNPLSSYQKWAIGNDIRKWLLANSDMVAKVGQKIYPVVAPESTKGSFICYSREKYSKQQCKMGVWEDDVNVRLTIFTDDYDTGVQIASLCDDILTGEHTDATTHITTIYNLVDSTEDFVDLKYVQTLLFEIK